MKKSRNTILLRDFYFYHGIDSRGIKSICDLLVFVWAAVIASFSCVNWHYQYDKKWCFLLCQFWFGNCIIRYIAFHTIHTIHPNTHSIPYAIFRHSNLHFTKCQCQKQHTGQKVIHNCIIIFSAWSTKHSWHFIQSAQKFAKSPCITCKVIHIHIVILHKRVRFSPAIARYHSDLFISSLINAITYSLKLLYPFSLKSLFIPFFNINYQIAAHRIAVHF